MNKDLFELPKFSRRLMRPQEEELGKQVLFPNWNCYCCHDTGVINPKLVKLIIPDYVVDKDKLPCCQNSRCSEGKKYLNNPSITSSLDLRFGDELCQKLDRIEREEWRQERETTISRLKIIDFALEKSLRRGDRSRLEQEQVDINHEHERNR